MGRERAQIAPLQTGEDTEEVASQEGPTRSPICRDLGLGASITDKSLSAGGAASRWRFVVAAELGRQDSRAGKHYE